MQANCTVSMNVAIRRTVLALIASIVLCGCAMPICVKRVYVQTWDHFNSSTNEVAK
jgi:hypothetical protein